MLSALWCTALAVSQSFCPLMPSSTRSKQATSGLLYFPVTSRWRISACGGDSISTCHPVSQSSPHSSRNLDHRDSSEKISVGTPAAVNCSKWESTHRFQTSDREESRRNDIGFSEADVTGIYSPRPRISHSAVRADFVFIRCSPLTAQSLRLASVPLATSIITARACSDSASPMSSRSQHCTR